MSNKNDINDIAARNWQWIEDMGWHNKTPLESLALIASEIGEAVNECRGLVPTENFATELADIVLRVGDLAHTHGIDLGKVINDKMEYNLAKGNYKNRAC